MQTTSRVVMVRPVRFAFNEETAGNNHFQQKTETVPVADKAIEEFDSFVELLRSNGVDVTVIQDTLEPWTPDSIFPNNWFSSHSNGELVLYPMFAENRRLERKPDMLNFVQNTIKHNKIIDLTHWEAKSEFLEGTGSMIFDRENKITYACRSPRTSEKVLEDFCKNIGFESVVFNATDKNKNLIYHTNVMMEIGSKIAIVCLESIENEEERNKLISRLKDTGKVVVEISLEQVDNFAGNMLELQSQDGNPLMVMSTTARNALTAEQIATIEKYTKIVSPEISIIEKNGGGSARCMIAEIFYK
ncbi:amidinotransferase [Bacteroidales bacterium OttesenSCG-928-I21]|nr:amidinotransferase [Bacteroidales bacterium OttesenSCG-928-I21]